MSILDTVATQIRHMGLPLFAVSLSAIPCADTPLLLMLHWHGFRPAGPRRAAGPPREPVPVPASALQLAERWHDLATVERAVLDAAWQLGAWNLERDEKRACNTIGASPREALECRQAFGDFPPLREAEALIEEAPDRRDLMHLAAERGYVCWQFRPVSGGVWAAHEGDDTLDGEGRRAPPCPVVPLACKGGKATRTVYRLGRVNRLIY